MTLLELMVEHPEIGIAGPRLEQPDGTFDHASRRSFPTLLERSATSAGSAGG